jgi:tRNA 2-thiocytidine biosynthesis protein TtcA
MKEKDEKYIENLQKRIYKTLFKQKLLAPDDRIMVGLSGGKDSLILLESLAKRRKQLPFKIELMACHVMISNIGYKVDTDFLREFCENIEVPFYLEQLTTELDETGEKSACFLCSWNRRKVMFRLTKELKCNKLAFGHHMDDALETLFMNMVYHGSLSSLPFKFNMFGGRLQVIRPLLEITDTELEEYALNRNWPKEIKVCPYDDITSRSVMKNFVTEMAKLHKNARKNMFRSMNNTFPEYLPLQE